MAKPPVPPGKTVPPGLQNRGAKTTPTRTVGKSSAAPKGTPAGQPHGRNMQDIIKRMASNRLARG